jgi:hypothetical protein
MVQQLPIQINGIRILGIVKAAEPKQLRPHFQWMSDDRIIVTNAQHAALFIPTRVGPLHDLLTLIRTKVNQISVQLLVWNLSQFLFLVVSMKFLLSGHLFISLLIEAVNNCRERRGE